MARPKGVKNKVKENDEILGDEEIEETEETEEESEENDEDGADEENEEIGEDIEDDEVDVAPKKIKLPKYKKPTSYKLIARIKSKDEEGNTVIFPIEATGKTLKECLQKMEFPTQQTSMVKVSAEAGEEFASRSFAPTKWNALYEQKNGDELGRLLFSKWTLMR